MPIVSEPIAVRRAPSAQLPQTRPPQVGPRLWHPSVIRALYNHGAHFVFCHDDKSAMWKAYTQLRPDLDTVLDFIDPDTSMYHGGRLLGILPHSLGYTVLDVDKGDPQRLVSETHPASVMSSQQTGRAHVWYRDPGAAKRGNGPWEAFGCSGEVRAKQNLVLWRRNPDRLLAMVESEPRDLCVQCKASHSSSPPDILSKQRTLPKFSNSMKPSPAVDSKRRWVAKQQVTIDMIEPGSRNPRFFQHVAYLAYRKERAEHTSESWHDLIEQTALDAWHQMPGDAREAPGGDGLPFSLKRDVRKVARSIAAWTWVNDTCYCSDCQSFRAVCKVENNREKYAARLGRVRELRADGLTQTEIGAREGLSKSRVSELLSAENKARKAEARARVRELRGDGFTQAEIGKRLGLNRRTVMRILKGR